MYDDKRKQLIATLRLIARDVEGDAKSFDGKPFDGRTVGEYMGSHGAAIAGIANIIIEILKEE